MVWTRYLWLGIGQTALLAAVILFYDGDGRAGAAALSVAAVAHLINWNYRCPRCRAYLGRSREGYYGIGATIPDDCVVCGRAKRGTWPFQWLVKPER